MRCILLLCAATLLAATAPRAHAQNRSIPPGSKILIMPMEKNLDGFITAEIQKQRLPVEVVLKQ